MNNTKKIILGIIAMVVLLGFDTNGQDCFELNGSQTSISGPYKGRSFDLHTQKFKTALECANAASKYGLSKSWRYSVNCKPCEGYRKDNALVSGGNKPVSQPNTTSQPKTSEKPITPPSNTPSTGMVKKKEIDLNSLCPSQRQNIEKLQDKQNTLDKSDVTMHSFINSSINNMVNVECGVVLKDLNCVGKRCEFEWAPQKSTTSDAKGQASVKQFKDAVVKDLKAAEAEVAKQKAETERKNAKQAENVALAQMVVSAATVIADAIDGREQPKQANQQSSERFTKVDDDGDGKADALVEKTSDGGQNLYIDTNGDGIADRVAHIDRNGKNQSVNVLNKSNKPIYMNQDVAQTPKLDQLLVAPYKYDYLTPSGRAYTLHMNSYHPDDKFGDFYGIEGKGYAGDNRGNSLEENATARVHHSVTIDPAASNTDGTQTYSDPSTKLGDKPKTATAKPESYIDNVTRDKNSVSFETGYNASNPLLPSPKIDIASKVTVKEDLKNGYLDVNIRVKGDDFPNTEVFINDKSNHKLFLGADSRNNTYDRAPVILFGGATTEIINTALKVKIDPNGNFTGVIYKEKYYDLDAWNKQFIGKK